MSVENEGVEKRIENYNEHINDFRYQSNIQGIWLFTATLGCWSVSVPWLQMVAALSLLFIFFFLVKDNVRDKRTFQQMKEDIEKDIETSLFGDARMARLYQLGTVEKHRASLVVIIKQSPIFFVCYIFYTISIIYFFINLF
ncbi:Uncharacterised protein [Raoultella terrigena]|nr:Uncharacterised protein [Raoultella terrigena]